MRRWPSPELAQKQVDRYNAALVNTPPDTAERDYIGRQLAWWVLKLAEVSPHE